ncbi:MAG: CinA family protein [Pseudomonadota bacterium]
MARAKRLRVVTAESCTGGLVSAALTDIPGSSDVFDRGFLTYSYAAKTEMLGVGTELLATHGAVSSEVAQAMAEGALARSDGHLSIAVTGVAGPGASDAKPEGMVWFAVANGAQTATKRQDFGPLGRANVRSASVDFALDFAAQILGRTL